MLVQLAFGFISFSFEVIILSTLLEKYIMFRICFTFVLFFAFLWLLFIFCYVIDKRRFDYLFLSFIGLLIAFQ